MEDAFFRLLDDDQLAVWAKDLHNWKREEINVSFNTNLTSECAHEYYSLCTSQSPGLCLCTNFSGLRVLNCEHCKLAGVCCIVFLVNIQTIALLLCCRVSNQYDTQ
jgi:hypothetical protein